LFSRLLLGGLGLLAGGWLWLIYECAGRHDPNSFLGNGGDAEVPSYLFGLGFEGFAGCDFFLGWWQRRLQTGDRKLN
jgi:hypothetical protein